MTKRVLFLFSLLMLLSVSFIVITACDYNAPLRNKMLDYYSENSNYQNLRGVVVGIEDDILEIDISTENNEFSVNINEYQKFRGINYKDWICNIKEGDEVSFVTAPMYFYNGHILPIVSIEKEGQVYLSFDKGKEDYLQWIEETFD